MLRLGVIQTCEKTSDFKKVNRTNLNKYLELSISGYFGSIIKNYSMITQKMSTLILTLADVVD